MAIRAIEEGRADHVADRTFTMAEIRRELGIGALWYTDFTKQRRGHGWSA